jgi:hypothetical protein
MSFKMKEIMRVRADRKQPITKAEGRLSASREAVQGRERELLDFLAENGAQGGTEIGRHLGYNKPGSTSYFLKQMILRGKIQKTATMYHLPGQSPVQGVLGPQHAVSLLEGDSNQAKALRWLIDHQDQPILINELAEAGGYINNSGVYHMLGVLKTKKVLRQYRAPEDKGWQYRFQFTNPELSGVKVTQQPIEETQEEEEEAQIEEHPAFEVDPQPNTQPEEEPEEEDDVEVPEDENMQELYEAMAMDRIQDATKRNIAWLEQQMKDYAWDMSGTVGAISLADLKKFLEYVGGQS